MKYLKKYNTQSNFNSEKLSFTYPTVSLILENDKVNFMGNPYWTVVYNVTSTSGITPMFLTDRAANSYSEESLAINNYVESVIYNGVDIINDLVDTTVINGRYTLSAKGMVFSSTGQHTIKFTFKNAFVLPTAIFAMCPIVDVTCSKAIEVLSTQCFYKSTINMLRVGKEVNFMGKQVLNNVTTCNDIVFEDGEPTLTIACECIASSGPFNTLDFKNRAKIVGWQAFNGLNSLTSITFGEGLQEIGKCLNQYDKTGFIIANCPNLESVTFKSKTPPVFDTSKPFNNNETIANQLFYNCAKFKNNGTGRIYVPAESVDAYKAATGFSPYADYITAIV